LSEHLDLALRRTATIRAEAEERSNESQREALERCFSESAIVLACPAGPSPTRGVKYSYVECPGDLPDAVAVLEAHGKRAIAQCSLELRAKMEHGPLRAQWETLDFEPGQFAARHALNMTPWDGAFRYLPEQQLLAYDIAGDAGTKSSLWRLVNCGDEQARAHAAALLLLANEPFPGQCINRAEIFCTWSRMSVTKTWIHAGLRMVLHIAYSALITAERLRRTKEAEDQEQLR
jgi:hypothetical protein